MALGEPSASTDVSHILTLRGQGSIVATFEQCSPFSIRVRALSEPYDDDTQGYVEVQVHKGKAIFAFRHPGNKTTNVLYGKSTTHAESGLDEGEKVSYWLSFDRNQRILKYGKGYIMEETTLLTQQFPLPQKNVQDPWNFIFSPDTVKEVAIKDLKCVKGFEAFKLGLRKLFSFRPDLKGIEIPSDNSLTLYPHPLTHNWPPLVLDSTEASLVELSSNKYMLSASLPRTCRELYENVASANVNLDWPQSKPNLSVAIDYSIKTPGKILHEKLKEKGQGNGMSYLRITLGCHRGSSPGIPYVLEIWPPKSFSPIHNHGNAYAVIKVLHGAIRVSNYNKTWKGNQEELLSFTVSKGDITWMSPNWFQTHKLSNESEDHFCATIQCYKFGERDDIQWPYFNYLVGESVEDFLPIGDFDFKKLREELLVEYNADH